MLNAVFVYLEQQNDILLPQNYPLHNPTKFSSALQEKVLFCEWKLNFRHRE